MNLDECYLIIRHNTFDFCTDIVTLGQGIHGIIHKPIPAERAQSHKPISYNFGYVLPVALTVAITFAQEHHRRLGIDTVGQRESVRKEQRPILFTRFLQTMAAGIRTTILEMQDPVSQFIVAVLAMPIRHCRRHRFKLVGFRILRSLTGSE